MKLYELWFRIVYAPLIKERRMTACLRPGDRTKSSKGTTEGSNALIKIISTPGSDCMGIEPNLEPGETKVRITKIVVKRFGDLTGVDLVDCSADCRSREMARYHLGLIYNKVFGDNDIVSIIYFEYLD